MDASGDKIGSVDVGVDDDAGWIRRLLMKHQEQKLKNEKIIK